MKVLLGLLAGGAGGFLLSRYVFPPGVTVACGSAQVLVNANGTVTLPNGIVVPLTAACSILSPGT